MCIPYPNLCVEIEFASTTLSLKEIESGGETIIIEMAGTMVARFDTCEVMPGVERFSSWTTRGRGWQYQSLSYLAVIDGEMYLIGHPWWQSRFAISLRELKAVPTGPLMSKLVEIERQLVVEGLNEILQEPSCQEFRATCEGRAVFTQESLFRLVGDLELYSLVPVLREIESWQENSGRRRVIQIALRKLGHSPRYPILNHLGQSCFECDPEYYASNRLRVLDARPGMDAEEISKLIGPPDAISFERWELRRTRWQFDIEMNEPLSVVLYLPQDGTRIEKIKHYRPALWRGPKYFSSEGPGNCFCNEVSMFDLDTSFLGSSTEILSSNERPYPSSST